MMYLKVKSSKIPDKFNFAPLRGALQGLSPSDLRSDVAVNLARIESGRVNEIVHAFIAGNPPSDYSEFITSFGYDISYRYMVIGSDMHIC